MPEDNKNIKPLQFMQNIINLFNSISQEANKNTHVIKCPKCGITPHQINVKGRYGCPHCYKFFAAPKLIEKIQGSSQHVGKVPKRWAKEQQKIKAMKRQSIPLDFRITSLKMQMTLAAKKEDYQTASIIKTAIKEIEIIKENINNLQLKLLKAYDENHYEEISNQITAISEKQNEIIDIEMILLN